MAKWISIILLSTRSVLLNSSITMHVSEKLLATLLLTTAKNRKDRSGCSRVGVPWGKGSWHHAHQLPPLIMGTHLKDFISVPPKSHCLKQLNKSIKEAAQGAAVSTQQQVTASPGARIRKTQWLGSTATWDRLS